jgi:NADH-quinone oxidoreductase subunit N
LAYSSIAHGGYLLIGLSAAFVSGDAAATLGPDGTHAVLLYLAVYALATIGAFAVLAYVRNSEQPLNGVDELAGLSRTQPLAAVAMSVFLFSLAGIPPLAGFWGKLALFRSAVGVALDQYGSGADAWFIGLAVIGGLNAAIAAAYYLRIVGTMFFRAPLAQLNAGGGGAYATIWVAALLILAVGLSPRLLIGAAYSAAKAAGSSRPILDQTAQESAEPATSSEALAAP